MLATAQRHSPEELALRGVPALGPLAVDPVPEVGATPCLQRSVHLCGSNDSMIKCMALLPDNHFDVGSPCDSISSADVHQDSDGQLRELG